MDPEEVKLQFEVFFYIKVLYAYRKCVVIKVSLCFSELLTQIWVTATPSDAQSCIDITGRTLRALFLFPLYRWRACEWDMPRKLCQREKSEHSQRLSSDPEEDGSLRLVARDFSLHNSYLISSKKKKKPRQQDVFCQTVLPLGKPERMVVLSMFLKRLKIKKSQKTTKLQHFLHLGQAPVSQLVKSSLPGPRREPRLTVAWKSGVRAVVKVARVPTIRCCGEQAPSLQSRCTVYEAERHTGKSQQGKEVYGTENSVSCCPPPKDVSVTLWSLRHYNTNNCSSLS